MTMHDDVKSLRDRYKRTAKRVREGGRQAAYQLALAEFCDDVTERLDRILDRYEGYVVVPREPTEEQRVAGVGVALSYGADTRLTAPIYSAMIEAAEQKAGRESE